MAKSVFILTLFICLPSVASEIPINNQQKLDLNQETQSLNLTTESLVNTVERAAKDRLTMGIRQTSISQLSVITPNQTTFYDLTPGVFVGLATPLTSKDLWSIDAELRVGYHRTEQNTLAISSAVHIAPVTLEFQYVYRAFKLRPYVGAGVQAQILSQQGARAVRTSELDLTGLLGAGLLVPVTKQILIDFKTHWLTNIETQRDWAGAEIAAGIAVQI